MTRTCPKCRQEIEESAYGSQRTCKACTNAYAKAHRAANRTKFREWREEAKKQAYMHRVAEELEAEDILRKARIEARVKAIEAEEEAKIAKRQSLRDREIEALRSMNQ